MAHQRTVIRQAIRALLDGATDADDRVFATRMLPLDVLELPAIGIYTLEETTDEQSRNTAPRELTRNLSVTIEAWVAPGSDANPDDAMDEFAEQIENAMDVDPYFDGAAADSWLDSTTLDVVIDGDREMGLATLTYRVIYRTLAQLPPLDDFESVAASHNLGNNVHPDDVAVDTFVVEESP